MKKKLLTIFNPFIIPTSLLFFISIFVLSGCQKVQDELMHLKDEHAPKLSEDYKKVTLVANTSGYNAGRIDASLVNAWGLTFSSTGIAWISANGTGVSTVYKKDGSQVLAPVAIPSPNMVNGGTPTGVVFNSTSDFVIPANGNPARFIFVGEDGIISAWNAPGSAITVADHSKTGAVYKGVTLGNFNNANYLFAANFGSHKIDVFDKDFKFVTDQLFQDKNLPSGYAPFNIQNINGKLYVAYAKLGSGLDEEQGAGFGYVDVFNANGILQYRLASQGTLNAPWGMAWASSAFINDKDCNGNGAILIGNFGDGRINAYTTNGKFLGQLMEEGKPLTIEGLWGISFQPGTATGADATQLFFAAGPNDEKDGLFGYIMKK